MPLSRRHNFTNPTEWKNCSEGEYQIRTCDLCGAQHRTTRYMDASMRNKIEYKREGENVWTSNHLQCSNVAAQKSIIRKVSSDNKINDLFLMRDYKDALYGLKLLHEAIRSGNIRFIDKAMAVAENILETTNLIDSKREILNVA